MTLERTTAGINKTEDDWGMDAPNGFADVRRWVSPTTVSSSPISRVGPPGDSYDRSSVTFDLRQCSSPLL